MLGWVTGVARSQQDENIDPDNAPDTPAHVFAARAFKSLLFGTPAPNDITTDNLKRFSRLNNLSNPARRHSTENVLAQTARPVMQPRHSDPMVSPSKGILVAPGSISSKRKSVTFRALEQDANAVQNAVEDSRQQTQNILPLPVSSPTKVKSSGTQQDLRRTLFEQRIGLSNGEKKITVEHKEQAGTENENENECNLMDAAQSKEKSTSETRQTQVVGTSTEERTIDLNQPRSTSGQHWKREYERDHDNSKAEMKRLIQYSQMTKSYAEKRDRDAVTMTQRLNATEAKAKSLEKKIQNLTAQLMDAKLQGGDQDSILNEVANQTAEIMKYQSRAERYRAALHRNETLQPSTDDEEGAAQEAPSAEIAKLRSDLAKLKLAADKAESHASKMEKENAVLSDRVKQMKTARTLQEQQYDEMSSRLKKKEGRLREDNLRLSKELQTVKAESASLKEQLLVKNSTNPTTHPKSRSAQEKLFDLSFSRLPKESTPPTSDEELRPKLNLPLRKKTSFTDSFNIDFSLAQETPMPKPNQSDWRKSYSNQSNDTFPLPRSISRPPQNTHKPQHQPIRAAIAEPKLNRKTDVCIELSTELPITTPIEPILSRKSSPLMKSFIDDLGSRRSLPPERIAAARKRLEEKAAIRRGTPKYGKVRDRMVA